MTTRVFIIPAQHKDAANAYAEHRGWGGPVFVQPLSADGQEPITHWGFPAVVSDEFIAEWDNPPPEAAPLVATVITDTRDGMDTAGHWYNTLEQYNLKQMITESETTV